MIDNTFNLIINKSPQIPKSFYDLIEYLELNYTIDILQTLQPDKLNMLKQIIFTLYELEKEEFQDVLLKIKREDLITLYDICKTYETDDFIAYYKRAIINKYTNNSS